MRSFIDRLVAARIGQTTNFYRDGTRRRRCGATGSRAYLESARGRAAAARRRGAGLPRRPCLGHPVHLRAPADRRGPGRGDRDDRPPRARRARADERGAALERRPDASRHRRRRTARRRGPRSRPAAASRTSSPAGARSWRRADRTRRTRRSARSSPSPRRGRRSSRRPRRAARARSCRSGRPGRSLPCRAPPT